MTSAAAPRTRTGSLLVRHGAAALVAGTALGVLGPVVLAAPVAATAGPVLAWGDNSLGQLGDGGSVGRRSPGPVTAAGSLDQVAGGRGHVLGLRADGAVLAWGSNEFGEVGDGTLANRRTPVVLPGLPATASVATGHYHSLAVGTDGPLWAWGYNAFGQLGLGSTANALRPARVPGLTGVVAAAGGREHSIALTGAGEVWGWGSNANGEVGDGTTSRRTSPVRVSGLPAVAGIAAARNTSYAWTASGQLWAWGRNDYGQVGDGSLTDRVRPVPVTGVGAVVEVSAGAFHVLARTAAGAVWSWGFNSYGNLGDGTTTRRATPQPVTGLPDVRAVGTGRDHSMAVTTAGDLWTWGRNDFGQLGDGTTTDRSRPVPIPSATDVATVGGGRDYTVASTSVVDDSTPPTVPGRPSAVVDASGRVTVTWAASRDERAASLRYTVFRDDLATVAGTVTSASTTTVSFTESGLSPGSSHVYAVAADDGINSSGPSAWSDPVTVPDAPPALLRDDFGSGLSQWSTVVGMTRDDTRFPPGSAAPSARAAVTNQAGYATTSFASTSPSVCAQANVLVTSLGSPTLSLLRLRTAAGVSVGRVYVTSAGTIAVRADSTGATSSSQARLPFGSWSRLALCGTVGASGTWRVLLGGVQVLGWSTSNATADFGRLQIGDSDPRTGVLNVDDVLVTTQ